MAAFEFKALDSNGRQKKGILEADSARQVRQQLRDKGWSPLEVELTSEKHKASDQGIQRRGTSLGAADLALVTRQIATLSQSGIPLEEALSAVSQQNEKPRIRSLMMAVRARVLEGYTLADSLGEFPNAFPKLYRSTVAAGEHAGHLDLVLNKLADYTEARQHSRQKIQLAAIYPIILTLVSITIVVFLLAYVVPDIIKVFVNNGQELPGLTQALLAASDFLVAYGVYLLIVLGVCIAGFRFMMTKKPFRLLIHKQLLEWPFIKKMSRGMNAARYVSTLSILNSSGVPLVDAMRISSEVLSNEYLKECLGEATQTVSEGGSLNRSLEQTGYFPPMMIHMIASGESSGELDQMLDRTARNQDAELEGLVTTIVGLFEPLMLLFMGGVVMIIVLAIMLPILNMSNLVG
ncbi:type II secretory pathway protein F [Oleiphilus messinensis]|uniref:Type II secretory pathway protein F n=1 Tax=Oleiphilus messinensis TaxID=141451 RepID=A0A1Y0IBW3_9GAMM|nr:type II secretion system inner membrane protein GspF [Oleiphilus messinensis]ARU56884.1 type II secretory pathway protein F [Oleiphilus messinensis]